MGAVSRGVVAARCVCGEFDGPSSLTCLSQKYVAVTCRLFILQVAADRTGREFTVLATSRRTAQQQEHVRRVAQPFPLPTSGTLHLPRVEPRPRETPTPQPSPALPSPRQPLSYFCLCADASASLRYVDHTGFVIW